MTRNDPHRTTDRFAARHLGVVTREAATGAGLTRHQIQRLVGRGQWVRVLAGTYVVAAAPRSWQQTALAACLGGPPLAVASHRTAAALWGLGLPPGRPEITVPRLASARSSTAQVHRVDLARRDRTTHGPIPVTSAARTLVDLAGVLSAAALADAVDAALDARLVSPEAVLRTAGSASRAPGKKGLPRLTEALLPWTEPIRPESPAEARLLRRLGEWGVAPPIRQFALYDRAGTEIGRLDLAWPDRRVGIEYDGMAFHSPRRFEHDERRHAAVEATGWSLLHADRLDLRPGDESLRHRLSAALAAAEMAS